MTRLLRLCLLLLLLWPPPAWAGEPQALGLADLEEMALERNPTLAQAASLVAAAEGRSLQAGLYPNPTVGYEGDEISATDPARHSQHYFFVEQRIVTAGKLRHGREVGSRERAEAAFGQEAQRRRVLGGVRMLFYQTLGAQRVLELQRGLADLSREAVVVSGQLYNVGQADRPEVLEAEMEAARAGLEAERAEIDLGRWWRRLAAEVGEPDLPRAPLEGDLEAEPSPLDHDAALNRLLAESPELAAAQAGVERAQEALALAQALRYPDVFVSAGFGYNVEAKDPEGFLRLGVPLPVFDRNQGGVAAAQAELEAARAEVRRLELVLRAAFAAAFADYLEAASTAGRYRRDILPRAEQAHEMYLARYRQMAAAYPQVLIARRTLWQSRVAYARALVERWRGRVSLENLLLTGALEPPGRSGY